MGQSPPTPKHQLGKPVPAITASTGKVLPNFGPYRDEKEKKIAEHKVEADILEPKPQPRVTDD
ncbi:hypothetical protein QHH03_32060, partial [Aphanizomenon sp. 202]|nr:hypothetical protein [Aphanizomenon sp. 202]